MTTQAPESKRFHVLDGWRGVSILMVLAAHLLPIGPKFWRLNGSFGVAGMAIFFTLSGFLITSFLLKHDSVIDFIVRRSFRILPLAWKSLLIALFLSAADVDYYAAHLFFYANLPPFWLIDVTAHFWSLCVEMQFYLCIALLVRMLGARGLWLLLPLAFGVTLARVMTNAEVSIVTWLRVDEILAGGVLSLAFYGRLGARPVMMLKCCNPYLCLIIFFASCHPASDLLNYFRPYLAAAVVGTTLLDRENLISRWLTVGWLQYIAAISFALYVIHPLLGATWLGSGSGWEKYGKRPLLFAVLLVLAHVSTFSFERRCIEYGKRFAARIR